MIRTPIGALFPLKLTATGLLIRNKWVASEVLVAVRSPEKAGLRTQKPNALFFLIHFLVELRGFEPLTSAVRLQRSPI